MISRSRSVGGAQHHHVVPEQIWKSDKRANIKDDETRAKFEKTNEFLREIGFTDKELDHYIKVLPRDQKDDPVLQGSTHRGPHPSYTQDCSYRLNQLATRYNEEGMDPDEAKEMVHRELVQLKQELRFEDIKLNGAVAKNQPEPRLEGDPGGVKTIAGAYFDNEYRDSVKEVVLCYENRTMLGYAPYLFKKFPTDLLPYDLAQEALEIALFLPDESPIMHFEQKESTEYVEIPPVFEQDFFDRISEELNSSTAGITVKTNVPNTFLAENLVKLDLNLKRFSMRTLSATPLKNGISKNTPFKWGMGWLPVYHHFTDFPQNNHLPNLVNGFKNHLYCRKRCITKKGTSIDTLLGKGVYEEGRFIDFHANYYESRWMTSDLEKIITRNYFNVVACGRNIDPSNKEDIRITQADCQELRDVHHVFEWDRDYQDTMELVTLELDLIRIQKAFIKIGKMLIIDDDKTTVERPENPVTPETLPPLFNIRPKVESPDQEPAFDCLVGNFFGGVGINKGFFRLKSGASLLDRNRNDLSNDHCQNLGFKELHLKVLPLSETTKALMLRNFTLQSQIKGPARFIEEEWTSPSSANLTKMVLEMMTINPTAT